MVFEVGAVLALRSLGGLSAGRIWAASQLAKYLPVPASAAAGMVGSSVRHGHSTRNAFALMVRHSILLVGAATIVGSPAIGSVIENQMPWAGTGATVLVAITGTGIVAMTVRNARLLRTRILAGLSSVAGWSAAAGGMAVAFSPSADVAVVVGSAYCAAWVAGQLVLPVPAGLGVREAALIGILSPTLGATEALGYAVLSRLLHVFVDGLLVAVVLGLGPLLGRTASGDDPRPPGKTARM